MILSKQLKQLLKLAIARIGTPNGNAALVSERKLIVNIVDVFEAS
jgi:hypothetical protein